MSGAGIHLAVSFSGAQLQSAGVTPRRNRAGRPSQRFESARIHPRRHRDAPDRYHQRHRVSSRDQSRSRSPGLTRLGDTHPFDVERSHHPEVARHACTSGLRSRSKWKFLGSGSKPASVSYEPAYLTFVWLDARPADASAAVMRSKRRSTRRAASDAHLRRAESLSRHNLGLSLQRPSPASASVAANWPPSTSAARCGSDPATRDTG